MLDFSNITSLRKVNEYAAQASSEDGETLYFEQKGTGGNYRFGPDEKNNLSKEICAFANTYGGIVCFHCGDQNSISQFSEEFCANHFNGIEGWLRDCLEPRFMGCQIKCIESIFLIHVPESKNKPHRTNTSLDYYYRHNTISQKMPEIMVSSLYRGQRFLDFSVVLAVKRFSKDSLQFSFHVANNSNISGTKPRIDIRLYGEQSCRVISVESDDFKISNSYSLKFDFHARESLKSPIVVFENTGEMLENILYPQSYLSRIFRCKLKENTFIPECLVGTIEVTYLESISKEYTALFDFSEKTMRKSQSQRQAYKLMSTDEYSLSEILNKYDSLIM